MDIFLSGHCVTTAYPGEVCDLDSYAVGCDVNGLSATACRCYQTEPDDITSSGVDPLMTDDDQMLNNTDLTMNDSDTNAGPEFSGEIVDTEICEGITQCIL